MDIGDIHESEMIKAQDDKISDYEVDFEGWDYDN